MKSYLDQMGVWDGGRKCFESHVCRCGANRNPWLGYQMVPSPTPKQSARVEQNMRDRCATPDHHRSDGDVVINKLKVGNKIFN